MFKFVTIPVLLACISQCLGQNATSSLGAYSHFELFKNTALQPCLVNNKTTITEFRSNPDVSKWTGGNAKSPNDYCRLLAGTPVIIPTLPTPAAFYPSWPSFIVQFIGLMFTYVGLWFTLRSLNKDLEKRDMKLPKLFWVQLPLDAARSVAWFAGFFKGLANIDEFPWISTVMWTVPFNYIWLLLLFKGGEVDSPSAPSVPTRKKKLVLRIATSIAIALTVAQWGCSLGACIIHYKYTWGALRARMYQPLPAVIANPASMGDLPQKCLDFISHQKLPVEFFSSYELFRVFIPQTIQFCVTTVSAFVGIRTVATNSYRRTYTMLRNSAAATQSCLFFSALGLLGFAFSALHNVPIWVTNDQKITGPCTFVVVQMWEIWGFYDVQHERIGRLVLNALGV